MASYDWPSKPTEYALKSATPWANESNLGPHHPADLNAQLTCDAKAIFDSAKMEYLSQLNITQAIINALNVAFSRILRAAQQLLAPSWEPAHSAATIIPAPSFLSLSTL
jgi:hypothetical protein